jgi:predicted alpha/beta-hydrolase family hydrolase
MPMGANERITIAVDGEERVSGLWQAPAQARAALALAHGAGAGMMHPFMGALADALGGAGIATLRYQFPYVEHGRPRTDPPPLCHATVRAAVGELRRRTDLPLFAGGKSFGGRMTSQAQASQPLPEVRGLVFVGFPLHAAGKPSRERARHLAAVGVPMLFLQGTRDELADLALLEPLCAELGPLATLRRLAGADHGFRVTRRSGRSEAEVLGELVRECACWMSGLEQPASTGGEAP